jgi:uncharacterized protein with FMN-binding domain
MKKLLKIVFIILTILLLSVATMMFVFNNGMEEAKAIQINTIDLSKLEDGEYIGRFELTRWSNEIKVTIKDHQIVKLEVLDDVMFKMDDITKALFERVKQNQSLDVDIETGATVTSHAYLKAIENALEGK